MFDVKISLFKKKSRENRGSFNFFLFSAAPSLSSLLIIKSYLQFSAPPPLKKMHRYFNIKHQLYILQVIA